jgi:hypothetical protein
MRRIDYVIVDGEKSIGLIYKEHREAKWFRSVNTSSFPTTPPNNWLGFSRGRSRTTTQSKIRGNERSGVEDSSYDCHSAKFVV